ncbi:MAG: glycosyltransferase family 2 protein [Candidatus Dojkabacteria bacterium]|nr:glycosyltransferase family 2 protein [Candidatus Dojkabacteria bacterium]MDQ7020442.1 glycosyltransferase family 2 protein [Candidatus Dojkabacteria bacterium]
MKNIQISVVAPIFNESKNINELHKRLTDTLDSTKKSFEIIYVENRSSDNSLEVLKKLKGARILSLRLPEFKYRTTQSIALDAGIKAAKGELIVTIDSDLQNPPEEIPKLLKKMEDDDLDVVSGWRKKRKDSFIIRNLSKLGSILRKKVINPGVHDLGCTLKIYKRETLEGIDLYGEMHRYLTALIRWKGFKVGELVIEHNARTGGTSAYKWDKMFRGFVDMWLIWFWKKYDDRPLHLFGVLGLVLALLGSSMLVLLAFLRIFGIISLSDSIWPLISVLAIITGTQFFIFGIMLDIIIKNYYSTSKEKIYTIKEDISV